jgi:hypothetical protein
MKAIKLDISESIKMIDKCYTEAYLILYWSRMKREGLQRLTMCN